MAQSPRQAADAGISIGQVFLGKYRVEEILGHGGMGVVVRCTHLGLNDQVAIKMLRQDVLLDRDATERFMREAQAASKLRSEHVARVVDVGTFHDSGVPYMIMEFLDGHDLGELIEQRGNIAVGWASMLILQAAEALAEAHSIGIVHRDVKPTNLFVTWRPDGSAIIKVLDFGISKAPIGTDMQLTQTQSLLGTPAYMSPEQMRSARLVDARTDIWSLGTVFYELLEGHRPFEAESFSEMCVKVAVDAPAPMTKTPPALQKVVLRCLAKSPEQRYANMAELGRDLVTFAQDVHHASMLVERMQRVLGRRSHVDWDQGGTNGGRAATPLPVRDIASAPVAAPWHGDSQPSGVSTIPKTPVPAGVPTQLTAVHDSAPAQTPSEIFSAPKKRSLLPLAMLGAFAIAGIAIGLVVGFSGSKTAEPKANTATTETTGSAQPIANPTPTPPPSPPPAVPDKSAAETSAVVPDKTPDKVPDKTPDKVPDKVPDKTPDKTKTSIETPRQRGTGTPAIRKPQGTIGKTKTVPVKDPKTPVKDPKDTKPVDDDCPAADRIRPGAPCASKSH